jgi:hypothetical protein
VTGRVMTGALERALNALSGVERRALIALAGDDGLTISAPLRSVLWGLRVELLADAAREADVLAALAADELPELGRHDPPLPVADGPALTFDPVTRTFRPVAPGEPGYE